MGRLLQLELENFKSYAGTQVIGPFYDFTCIIGPNGAGKSNLMDAISFVLGLQSKQLRSTNLKDLIFHKDNAAQPRRAIVRLLYVVSKDELDGYPADTTIAFARSVTSNGVSVYQFQDQNVTYEYYESVLQKLNVLVKVRNFLVFQGDIEAVASKSPLEITKLFEQICGSDALAAEYDTLLSQKDEAEQQTNFGMQKKKMFLAQNKEVKTQRDEANLFNQKQKAIKDYQSELVCMQLHQVHTALVQHEEALTEHRAQLDGNAEREQLNDQEIMKYKKQVADITKNQAGIEKKVEGNQKKLRELSNDLQSLQNKNKLLGKRKKDYEKQIENTEQDRTEQQSLIQVLQKKIQRVEASKAEQEKSLTSLQQEGGVNFTGDQLREYQRLKQECMQDTLVFQKQIDTEHNEISTLTTQLAGLNSQASHLSNELAHNESTIKDYEGKLQSISAMNQRYEEEVATLNQQRHSDVSKKHSLTKQVTDITKELADIEHKLTYFGYEKSKARQNTKLLESIQTMSNIFTGIHGKLVNLCKPIQKKYNVAINIVLNKYLDAIVVDNQDTARKCIAYLKEHHIASCIFLPLENLVVTDNTAKHRHQLPNKYKLCVDVIEFDSKFRNAILFAIGNTIVCDSLEDAQALAYHTHTQEAYKIVTLKGHIISKSGAMTGGFTQDHTRDRFQESEIHQLTNQKHKLESELMTVENELQSINTTSFDQNLRALQAKIHYGQTDYKLIQTKIEEVRQQLGLKQGHLEKLRESIGKLEREIAQHQQKLLEIETRRKDVEKEIFREFSSGLHQQNIVEMESILKDRKLQTMNEIDRLSNELTSLQSQLSFEQNKQYDSIIAKLRNQLNKVNQEMTENNASIDAMSKKEETLLQQNTGFKQQLASVTQEKEATMQLLKDLLEHKSEIMQEKSNIKKLISNEEISMEKHRHKLHGILSAATLEHIPLPGLDSEVDDEEGQGKDDEDDMDVEEPASGTAQTRSVHYSDPDNPAVARCVIATIAFWISFLFCYFLLFICRDRRTLEKLDFSIIKRQLRGKYRINFRL
ncbi:chromosome segregation protein SMC [archaeon]|nr:MAG: chromosome segregation protein SMC [archaeon]